VSTFSKASVLSFFAEEYSKARKEGRKDGTRVGELMIKNQRKKRKKKNGENSKSLERD
jgi:hypothetical protein